jgi:hypothetical protein
MHFVGTLVCHMQIEMYVIAWEAARAMKDSCYCMVISLGGTFCFCLHRLLKVWGRMFHLSHYIMPSPWIPKGVYEGEGGGTVWKYVTIVAPGTFQSWLGSLPTQRAYQLWIYLWRHFQLSVSMDVLSVAYLRFCYLWFRVRTEW